jgi:cytochrome c oxidase subunit 2
MGVRVTGGSPFDPAAPQAVAISHLFVLTLLLLGAILMLVTALVVYASYRFRARTGETGPEPEQVFGHRGLEIGWTVGPVVLLSLLFGLTLSGMRNADPQKGTNAKPDLCVIAHQWWWELRYPKLGITAANEIHLPMGSKVLARIESADVIHSFWVPQLGRKMDAIPGHPNHLWLEPMKLGIYLGSCSEYCGAEHAWMRLRVVVQTPEEFLRWTNRQRRVPSTPTDARAAAGEHLFTSKTCTSCHAVAGTVARARLGPDLTHVASRQTLGAGVITNTPAHLADWLRNPQAVKPGCRMPNMKLDESQVGSLVAYLETLQ